jgi:hypothetical protein
VARALLVFGSLCIGASILAQLWRPVPWWAPPVNVLGLVFVIVVLVVMSRRDR